MDLDRGALARLDRRLLAGLNREERFQMVRVPVTPATWSTWKRYCDIAGISMGRGKAALIDHELAAVLGEPNSQSGSWFEQQAQQPWRNAKQRSPSERISSPQPSTGYSVGANICEIASASWRPVNGTWSRRRNWPVSPFARSR